MAGKFNTSQQTFIDQFFAPFPTDPGEFATRAREYYVNRQKMIAAVKRPHMRCQLEKPPFIDSGSSVFDGRRNELFPQAGTLVRRAPVRSYDQPDHSLRDN